MSQNHEAKYFDIIDENRVQCRLCPHGCIIASGKYGICCVRKNDGGKLTTEIYGELSSVAMDPIEKKPLYHFFPGTQILSIGTKGCNLKCPYCQNWHISQDSSARTSYYSSEEIVDFALKNNSIGIAFTYSEPVIWFEYVLDTAILAKQKGLKNVLVTNGFISQEPLSDLLECVDAMNIDLKSFNESTYKRIQKAELESVKKTIEISYKNGVSIEITTLIVTGINDDLDEMKDIISFISSIDKNIPWHISRYYPNYKYDKTSTDIDFIYKVYNEAIEKLNFVYCGNVPAGSKGNDTICPSCGNVVISRSGYNTKVGLMRDGKCDKCGTDLRIRHQ